MHHVKTVLGIALLGAILTPSNAQPRSSSDTRTTVSNPASRQAVVAPGYSATPIEPSELSVIERLALDYAVRNNDELLFVKAGTSPSPEDEFSDTSQKRKSEQKSRAEALRLAQRILDGSANLPVMVPIRLLRYNPASQCFITDATQPVLNLALIDRELPLPSSAVASSLNVVAIHNWDRLGALRMPPEMAKELVSKLNAERAIPLRLHLRIRPGTISVNKDPLLKTYRASVEAEIQAFSARFTADDDRNMTFASNAVFQRHESTAAEREFLTKVKGKVFVSRKAICAFIDDRKVLLLPINESASLKEKYTRVVDGLASTWFLTDEQLCIINRSGSVQLFEVSISDEALRLNGTSFLLEKRINISGDRVRLQQ